MTTFPRRLDVFPPPQGPDPAALIGALYDAVEALESHSGFSCLSGGDTPITGTESPPSPRRTACLLEADHYVTGAQAGGSGIILRWADLFAESPLGRCPAVPCPDSQKPAFNARLTQDLPVLLRTCDPAFICATRGVGQLSASLLPGADASAYVSLCVLDGAPALAAGERIRISCLLYTGTL